MLRSFFADYFGFNRQQRNGLAVLLLICFLLLAMRIAYPSFIRPGEIVVKNLPLLELKLDSASAERRQNYETRSENTAGRLSLFVFDPNTVSAEQLVKLGFREKTAKRFIKFRSKGFVFKRKKDLQKVYGISDSFYAQLEPYILIGEKPERTLKGPEEKEPAASAPKEKKQTARVELNTADSITLVSINGIGPTFAKRILKYRSILGGYVSVEQLKEVYGFSEETYQTTARYFTVDPSQVKKIDLNKDNFKTVNKHPYLSYEHTKAIFDWRRKTVITAVNLRDILNDEALYRKLLPYLAFE